MGAGLAGLAELKRNWRFNGWISRHRQPIDHILSSKLDGDRNSNNFLIKCNSVQLFQGQARRRRRRDVKTPK